MECVKFIRIVQNYSLILVVKILIELKVDKNETVYTFYTEPNIGDRKC